MNRDDKQTLLAELRRFLEPLALVARSERYLRDLFISIGWNLNEITGLQTDQLTARLERFSELYNRLIDLIEMPDGAADLALEALDILNQLIEVMNELHTIVDGAQMPAHFEEVGQDLLQYLLSTYVWIQHPAIFHFGVLIGLILPASEAPPRQAVIDETGQVIRYPVVWPTVEFGNIYKLLTNPFTFLKNIYFSPESLNTPEAAQQAADKMFSRLAEFLMALHVNAVYGINRNYGLNVDPIAANIGRRMLTVYTAPDVEGPRLGMTFALSAAAPGDSGLGLVIRPFGADLNFAETIASWLFDFRLTENIQAFALGFDGQPTILVDPHALALGQEPTVQAQITLTRLTRGEGRAFLIGSLTGTYFVVESFRAIGEINLNETHQAYKLALEFGPTALVVKDLFKLGWDRFLLDFADQIALNFSRLRLSLDAASDPIVEADLGLVFKDGALQSNLSHFKLYKPTVGDLLPLNFHVDQHCLAFRWDEPNINRWLKQLAADFFDESQPVQSEVTVRVIFGNPIDEIRLDWAVSGSARTFALPGLIKVITPEEGYFSLLLGAGEHDLSHLAIAFSLESGAALKIASNFAWGRDDDRELQNNAGDAQTNEPIFILSLTAKEAVSLVLMEFDLAAPSLPKLLRQPEDPFQELDFALPESLCTAVSPFGSFQRSSWDIDFDLNLDQFQLPFLKDGGSNQFVEIFKPDTFEFDLDPVNNLIVMPIGVKINIGTLSFTTEFLASFNWETFALEIKHYEGIKLVTDKEVWSGEFLGLSWAFKGKKTAENGPHKGKFHLFTLVTEQNNYQIIQAPDSVFEIGYAGLSEEPIKFSISDFALTPKGLNITTKVVDAPIRLKGLDTKFRFYDSGFQIVENKIQAFTLAGTGPLPPDLVGEATANIFLQFGRKENGSLTLLNGKAELKGEKLLHCQGTRFQFSIDAIGLRFVSDGKFHLYFTLTGSARFVLADGDDNEGALGWLPNIQIDLVECPLTGDASVIARHIDFLIELPKPLSFNFLGAFEMELRAIGFVPQAPVFNGDGAMQLTGQLKFAQGAGDTMDARRDYHKLLIGLPEKGSFIPRIYFKNLPVNLNFGEAFRLNGTVEFFDEPNEKGFSGEGMVQIQGLPTIAASFGFFRVRRDELSPWVRAWFIYLEIRRVSFMVPIVQFYIREVGLGFGYRFTLVSIKAADRANDVRQLLAELKKLSRTQGDLSKRDRWEIDLEGQGEDPRWTIVLRALISQTSAAASPLSYNAATEKELKCVYLFDAIIALRSDLTFFMSARGWLNTNYADIDANRSILEKPLFSGFVILSPRRKRFLAHLASNPEGHLGSHPEFPDFIQQAIRNSKFSATLLIEPGLMHYELGWPNQLRWSGELGPLKVQIIGGFIFRISGRELVIGSNFMARGTLEINADFDAGLFGLSISAYADVAYGARYIGVLAFRDPVGSSAFYGAIGLELHIRIAIKFWIRLAFFKKKFKFSIGIDFTAALEVGLDGLTSPGLRGRGSISLSAMGHSIGFSVSLGVNEGAVEKALDKTKNFLNIGLEATDVEEVPGLTDGAGAAAARAFAMGPDLILAAQPPLARLSPSVSISTGSGDGIFDAPHYTVFVIRDSQDEGRCYFVILPQAQQEGGEAGFLPPPPLDPVALEADFKLHFAALDEQGSYRLEQFNPLAQPGAEVWQAHQIAPNTEFHWRANWSATIVEDATRYENLGDGQIKPATEGTGVVTLQEYLSYAFKNTAAPTADTVVLTDPDPIVAQHERPVQDERVYNPTDSAFEAAVRGAVEQFQGSPLFKRDPTYEYDRILGAAFDQQTTIYTADGTVPEGNEAQTYTMQENQQAHQVRGAIIHDLIADLREYVALPEDRRADFARTSIPFQMGLVFRLPVGSPRPRWLDEVLSTDAAQLPQIFQRRTRDGRTVSATSDDQRQVSTFNITATDFAVNPPTFERVRHYADANTIAIAWALRWTGRPSSDCTDCQADPEHHLLHYRVQRRALDGRERDATYSVKPAEVLHLESDAESNATTEKVLRRLKPRFQIVDHFNKETLAELAALPASGRSYLYTITPVDFAGKLGRPLTLVVTRYPNLPPPVPTDGEFLVSYQLAATDFVISEANGLPQPDLIQPQRVRVSWTLPSSPQNGPTISIAGYRLIFRREQTLPIGSFGLDSSTQGSRARSLPSSNARPLPTDIKIDLGDIEETPDGKRRATIPLQMLQSAGIFPPGAPSVWQPNAWRVFFQTISINGVPSALAPVELLLRLETLPADPDDIEQRLIQREERRPAELEWLPHPLRLSLLPPEDEQATPGTAHFPMPYLIQADPADLAFKFKGTLENVSYQEHPRGIRAIRFQWNQGPSHVARYPLDLIGGYHLLELDIDAHTTHTFQDAGLLAQALRNLQEIQMLPADDLLLVPADTLAPNQWEAWYPSAISRLQAGLESQAEGSENPYSPWYSWRESYLVWPMWKRCNENAERDGPIHPFLQKLIERLQGSEEQPKYIVDLQLGPPLTPMTLEDFFKTTSRETDPYGWGILQRFGLSVTFSLRTPSSGELVSGPAMLAALSQALSGSDGDHLKHLHVELLVQPGRMVELEKVSNPTESILLGIVQLSLRPHFKQYLYYSKIRLQGPAGVKVNLVFNLTSPATLIDPSTPAVGEVDLEPGSEPIRYTATIPLNGQVDILVRSQQRLNETPTALHFEFSLQNSRSDLQLDQVSNLFTYVSEPTPHFRIGGALPNLTEFMTDPNHVEANEQLENLQATLTGSDLAFFQLTLAAPTEFGVTNNLVTYFTAPLEALTNAFGGESEAIGLNWLRFIKYAESLNPTERDLPRIVLPRDPDFNRAEDQAAVSLFLVWAQRFFDAGPASDETPDQISQPWLATVYPRAGSPAYASPDESGRLQYDHLLEDKWAHTYRYYIRPYGRYDMLWRSLRQSPALFPDQAKVPAPFAEANPDPQAGGLDVVLDRIKPVETPLIVRTGRLDAPVLPGRSAPPGAIWEVLIAQHPEQNLMERNQTLARRLAFRHIAFTLLRRFSYGAWLSWLQNSDPSDPDEGLKPEIQWVEDNTTDVTIPASYPDQPDHLNLDFGDATNGELPEDKLNELLSISLPERVARFQQGVLAVQWDGLPFYYEHRLIVVAQSTTTVSAPNTVTQRDFEYRAPLASATMDGLLLNDKRLRAVHIPLKRLWDSLPPTAQEHWPDENPDQAAVAEGRRLPGDLPDPEVIYQIIEFSRGNVEVQAECYFDFASDQPAFSFRQLGKRFLVKEIELIRPEGSRTNYLLNVKLRHLTLLPLSTSAYNLENLAEPTKSKVELNQHLLTFEGVLTALDLANLKEIIDAQRDQEALEQLYQDWYAQVSISTRLTKDQLSMLDSRLRELIDSSEAGECSLIWVGPLSPEEQAALLALSGDDSFKVAIQRLIDSAQDLAAGEIVFEIALLGPDQKPPDLASPLDLTIQPGTGQVSWLNLPHEASLTLSANASTQTYTDLVWQGILYEDDRVTLEPELQRWAQIPALSGALKAILLDLTTHVAQRNLPIRPNNAQLAGTTGGKLGLEAGADQAPDRLIWRSTLPGAGDLQTLATLQFDRAFNAGLQRLLSQLMEANLRVVLTEEVELPDLQGSPVENRLTIIQEEATNYLRWSSPMPNAIQQQALNELASPPEETAFSRALVRLLQEIDLQKQVAIPKLVRITQEQVPDALRDQLQLGVDTVLWRGLIQNPAQEQALLAFAAQAASQDPDFEPAVRAIVGALQQRSSAAPVNVAIRPQQRALPNILSTKLLIGRASLRYHGLMTPEEGRSLQQLFKSAADQQAIERLYQISLAKGMRDRELRIRARRGSAVPSDMKRIVGSTLE